MSEVVVSFDGRGRVHGQTAKHLGTVFKVVALFLFFAHLHPNDGVDEEEDTHEETDVGQSLQKSISTLSDRFISTVQRFEKW